MGTVNKIFLKKKPKNVKEPFQKVSSEQKKQTKNM